MCTPTPGPENLPAVASTRSSAGSPTHGWAFPGGAACNGGEQRGHLPRLRWPHMLQSPSGLGQGSPGVPRSSTLPSAPSCFPPALLQRSTPTHMVLAKIHVNICPWRTNA